MPLTEQQLHRIVTRRTSDAYFNQKRRARAVGVRLDFELQDLRNVILAELGRPCCYCGVELRHNNFGVDHDRPVSGGGSWSISNCIVCCGSCNLIKGNMTGDEFRVFLGTLAELSPVAVQSIRSRLKASGKVVRC
jgi:5-methylcytosine-specific restriction endonuclease McrA